MDDRPALEVADVLRRFGPAYADSRGGSFPGWQRRVLRDLTACRTAALGGHVEACADCGRRRVAYNSCRNRHCPKCAGSRTADWLQRESSYLLPVEYYHVVFTLPSELSGVALANPRAAYDLLLASSGRALRSVAADPRYLGAEVGAVLVLHTWGQNLHHHPHVHAVVTGGGLACDGPPRWVSCRPGFFLPVRVLSRVFRDLFLGGLQRAWDRGRLRYDEAEAFGPWLAALQARDWVVYAKPPFAGPEVVLKYLARYTHRVAIGNRRLQAMDGETVTFAVKDYRDGGAEKSLTLPGVEFVRRFCQHVLPRGLVRVRHVGLLANRQRAAKLASAERLLGWDRLTAALAAPPPSAPPESDRDRCEGCGCRSWEVVERLPRVRLTGGALCLDTT